MSQFRPLHLVQQVETTDLTEAQPVEVPATPTPSITTTTLLNWFSDQPSADSTGSLPAISDPKPITPPVGRIVIIPGAHKSTPITEELPKAVTRMSPRMRHAIILIAILLVAMTTLLSLAPLDNGQSAALPIFTGIGNWVQTEQANWQLPAHLVQIFQNKPVQTSTQQVAAPPPMSLPTSAYVAIARQDAINAGISPDYFVRQINLESGFNPHAYSPSGAEGIAQFMPGTAAGLGFNPWDPNASLNAAAHLMANYAKNYGGD